MHPVSSRCLSLLAAAVAVSSLVLCSGCGKSAASAQTPPPQTLSEPVRQVEPAPTTAPAIPVSASTDEFAVKKGESRELPAFVEPAPAPPAPAAATAADPKAVNGCFHTLAKGETLYALSRKYNVKVGKIIEANQFKDPSRLAIGTKVYIPN